MGAMVFTPGVSAPIPEPESTRNWEEWDLEHPYLHHPKKKNQSAVDAMKEALGFGKGNPSIKPGSVKFGSIKPASIKPSKPDPYAKYKAVSYKPSNAKIVPHQDKVDKLQAEHEVLMQALSKIDGKVHLGGGLPPYKTGPGDLTMHYKTRDLHAENGGFGDTPPGKARYGGVMFDSEGRVLLREPTNHFDGYVWTFPKGHPDEGEHPVDTAVRETVEETGKMAHVIGHVPGSFGGSATGSKNHFYLLQDAGEDHPELLNGETQAMTWATPAEAHALISQSTNISGRDRDRQTLRAAVAAHEALTGIHNPDELPPPETDITPKPVYKPSPKPPKQSSVDKAAQQTLTDMEKPTTDAVVTDLKKGDQFVGADGKTYKVLKPYKGGKIHVVGPSGSHKVKVPPHLNVKKLWNDTKLEWRDADEAIEFSDIDGLLEARNWELWNLEHPYQKHGYHDHPNQKDYSESGAKHYAEAKAAAHLTPTQLKAKRSAFYAKAKKALAEGDLKLQAQHLGAAHAYGLAAKEKQIEEAKASIAKKVQDADAKKVGHAITVEPSAAEIKKATQAASDAAKLAPTVEAVKMKNPVNEPKLVVHTRQEFHGVGTSGQQSNKFYESAIRDNGDGTFAHLIAYGSTKPGAHVTTKVSLHSTVDAAFTAHNNATLARSKHGYSSVGKPSDQTTILGGLAKAPKVNTGESKPVDTPKSDLQKAFDAKYPSKPPDTHQVVKLPGVDGNPGKEVFIKHFQAGPHMVGEAPAPDQTPEARLKKAILAEKVARAVGADVPESFAASPTVHVSTVAPGVEGSDTHLTTHPDHEDVDYKEWPQQSYLDSASGKKLGLADVLMGNADRNTGNWFVSGHPDHPTITGIDHDEAQFPKGDVAEGGSPFASTLVKADDTGGVNYLPNDFTKAQMDAARIKLQALKPEFDKVGMSDEHDAMMQRFEKIAAKAQDGAKPSTSSPISTHASPDGMPKDIHFFFDATTTAGPIGSNPGQWYKMPNGDEYLLKDAKSRDHAENEVAVGKTFEVAGAAVPKTSVVDLGNGKWGVASKKVEGLKPVTPGNADAHSQAAAREHFGIDALTSNYDAFGLPSDPNGRNFFKGSDGKYYRIDSGGGGFYRAMGGPKPGFKVGSWDNPDPTYGPDYKSLRVSEQGKLLYGLPSHHADEIAKSLDAAANLDLGELNHRLKDAGISSAFRDKYLEVLKDRQDHLKAMSKTTTPKKAFAADVAAAHFNGVDAAVKMHEAGATPAEIHNAATIHQENHPGDALAAAHAKGMHDEALEQENKLAGGDHEATQDKIAGLPPYEAPEVPSEHQSHPASYLQAHEAGYNAALAATNKKTGNPLTPTQMKAKAATFYAKGKAAKAAGNDLQSTQHYGTAHGYVMAAKAIEKHGGAVATPKASVATAKPTEIKVGPLSLSPSDAQKMVDEFESHLTGDGTPLQTTMEVMAKLGIPGDSHNEELQKLATEAGVDDKEKYLLGEMKKQLAGSAATATPESTKGPVTVFGHTMTHADAVTLQHHFQTHGTNMTVQTAAQDSGVPKLNFHTIDKPAWTAASPGQGMKTKDFALELDKQLQGKPSFHEGVAAEIKPGDLVHFTKTHNGEKVGSETFPVSVKEVAESPQGNIKIATTAGTKHVVAPTNPITFHGNSGAPKPAAPGKVPAGAKVSKHNYSASSKHFGSNVYKYGAGGTTTVASLRPGQPIVVAPKKFSGNTIHTVISLKHSPGKPSTVVTEDDTGHYHQYTVNPQLTVHLPKTASTTPSTSTPGVPMKQAKQVIASASAPIVNDLPKAPADAAYAAAIKAAQQLMNNKVPLALPQRDVVSDEELRQMDAYGVAKANAKEKAKDLTAEDAAKQAQVQGTRQQRALSAAEQAQHLGMKEGFEEASQGSGVITQPVAAQSMSIADLEQTADYKKALADAQKMVEHDATSRDLYQKAGELKAIGNDKKHGNASALAQSLAYQKAAEKLDFEEGESISLNVPTGTTKDLTPAEVTAMKEKAKPQGGDHGGDLEQWAYNQGRALGIGIGNAAMQNGANAADLVQAAKEEEKMAAETHGLVSRKHQGAAHVLYRVAVAKHEGGAPLTTSAKDNEPKPDVQYHRPGTIGTKTANAGHYTIKTKFTPEEEDAIKKWTGPSRWDYDLTSTDSFYTNIQRIMAGQKPHGAGAAAAKAFFNAAATKSVPSKQTIFRGTLGGEFHPGQLAEWKKAIAKGETVDVSIPMQSSSYNDSMSFTKKPYLYVIDPGAMTLDIGPKSTMGASSPEMETIPGGLFEVYKIDQNPKKPGQTRIFMRQKVHYPS